MRFVQISSPAPVVEYLTKTLAAHLGAGERVLWFVPGGSSIAIAAEVSRYLANQPLENLTVTLTDERWGEVGHHDSNWRQLTEAGFKLPGATLLPVLSGQDRDATAVAFAALLKDRFAAAEYRLGFFGVGPDGHTAGILPESPAVAAAGLAAAYDAGVFQRLTMTPRAIARLDEAVVYAVGEAKWPALDNLDHDVGVTLQPAQSLKQVPALTIFNDRRGE